MLTYELLQQTVQKYHQDKRFWEISTPPAITLIAQILAEKPSDESVLTFSHVQSLASLNNSSDTFDAFPHLKSEIAKYRDLTQIYVLIQFFEKPGHQELLPKPMTYIHTHLQHVQAIKACLELFAANKLMDYAPLLLENPSDASEMSDILSSLNRVHPSTANIQLLGGDIVVEQLFRMMQSENKEENIAALKTTILFILKGRRDLFELRVVDVFAQLQHIQSIAAATQYEISHQYFDKMIVKGECAGKVAKAIDLVHNAQYAQYQSTNIKIRESVIAEVLRYPSAAIEVASAAIVLIIKSRTNLAIYKSRHNLQSKDIDEIAMGFFQSALINPAYADRHADAIMIMLALMRGKCENGPHDFEVSVIPILTTHSRYARDLGQCAQALYNLKDNMKGESEGNAYVALFIAAVTGEKLPRKSTLPMDEHVIGALRPLNCDLSWYFIAKIQAGYFINSTVPVDKQEAENCYRRVKDVDSEIYVESQKGLLEILHAKGDVNLGVEPEKNSIAEKRVTEFNLIAGYVYTHGGSEYLNGLMNLYQNELVLNSASPVRSMLMLSFGMTMPGPNPVYIMLDPKEKTVITKEYVSRGMQTPF